MLDVLNNSEKKAIARVLLGILSLKTDGRIRTNDPDIYNLFVDLFYVETQEEIFPIIKEIVNIEELDAAKVISSLSNKDKDEIRKYLMNKAEGNKQVIIAIALLMKTIGFNTSYFK